MNRLTRLTLPNGITVLYHQDPGFPLATATLMMRAGSRLESSAQAGLTSMSIDLLMQGTRKRDARGIARVMESIGASMGTQAHEDYSELGFVAPAGEFQKALRMMTEVLTQPSFPAEEIKKERQHILAGLHSRRDAIFHLAYDHFAKAMFGDHPYGRPLEGRVETVARFTRDSLKTWYERHTLPEGAILSIVAPQSARQGLEWVRRALGSWSSGKKPAAPSPAERVKALNSSHRSEVSSAFEQAYLMTGWQAPNAFHRDQMPLKVLNTILGGGMSSRLFVTLREELGLAYEVSSFYPTRLDLSQWVIYLGLPAERLPLAAQRLEKLLESFAQKGPTDAEMQQARAMIRGSFLMDRQSRRRQGWYAAWWEFLGRGADYSRGFLSAIDSVTASQVRDLMRRFMDQPRVTVKVVPRGK